MNKLKWEKHLFRYKYEAVVKLNKMQRKDKDADIFPLKRNGVDCEFCYFVGSNKQFKKFMKHLEE